MHFEFAPLDPANLDSIRGLWLALHRHHMSVAPQLAPFASEHASWEARKARYQSILENNGRIIVASNETGFVGYVATQVRRMPWPATFKTAPTVLEVHGPAVIPQMCDKGLDRLLLDQIDLFAQERELENRMAGMVSGHSDAMRLFEQRGFKPAWLTLTRFDQPLPDLPDGGDVPIHLVAPDDVDGFRDIWLAVHRHHQASSPELAPFVSDAESWAVFAPIFEHAAHEGLLFAAGSRGAPYGLACVEVVQDRADFRDIWQTGKAIAEIEVMAVNAEMRGRGVGSALLAHIFRSLRARQVTDCCVGAIHGNTGAIRLYERTGFRPAWVEMTRFNGS